MAQKVKAADLVNGFVYRRQGGTTGDGSWHSAGTSNTDTTQKDTFVQVGSNSAASTGSNTVTFPAAYNQVPVVLATVTSATGANVWVRISAITTTTFTYQLLSDTNTGVSGETISWVAIGQ